MRSKSRVGILTFAILGILAIALLPARPGVSAEGGGEDEKKETGQWQEQVLSLPEKAGLKYFNLGSHLDQLVARFEEQETTPEDAAVGASMHQGESVAVTIYLSGSVDDVVAFLEENGGDPRNVGEDYIEAYVPVSLLGPVSEQPVVIRVRGIVPPLGEFSPVPSQGVQAHLSASMNQAGYTGRGFKVRTIDGHAAFTGCDSLIDSELPTPALGNLTNLENLVLWGNQLSGCVPEGLRDVPDNDLANLGLPFCGTECDQAANNPGLVSDCEELLAARDILRGTATLNWSASTPITHWEGVGVAGSPRRVTSVFLPNKELTGTIPTKLSSLSNLTRLALYQNELTGTIPPELGNLSNLTELEIFSNELTGTIPTELSSLSNLTELRLFSNELTGAIPFPLGNLTELRLNQNQLTGTIPSSLSNLTNLQVIGIAGNQLTGCVPAALRDVEDNDFSQLGQPFCETPASGDHSATRSFSATMVALGTEITVNIALSEYGEVGLVTETLPGGFTFVSGSVEWTGGEGSVLPSGSQVRIAFRGSGTTNVAYNVMAPPEAGGPFEFTGTFVNSDGQSVDIGGASTVTVADEYSLVDRYDVNDNGTIEIGELSTAIEDYFAGRIDISQLFALIDLYFSSPTGSAPSVGSPKSDREALAAFYNATGGPNWRDNTNWLSDAPLDEWQHVSTDSTGRVTGLFLNYNQLSGEIPPQLGNLSSLEWLEIDGNHLSGKIPAELSNLANLEKLGLDGNQLSGEIPPRLGNLANLEYLYLSDNKLSGEIPAALGRLSNLEHLYLGANLLNGEMPSELGNLANLEWLGLSGNQLTGDIAPELGNLAFLEGLILGGNQLSGEIPPWLGNLANLEWLGLSGNQLTGDIAPELGNLAFLEGLGLGGNQLSGEIPPELSNLVNLTWLDLSGNQLSGEIPVELGNLAFLEVLDLGDNQLSGEIPVELGNLASLTWLDLRSNQLTGGIPPDLGNLANLEFLALGENQLTGEIPAELGSLANLESLELERNLLSGGIPPDLGNLPNLEYLGLSRNLLSGEIPEELGDLASLTTLRIDGNQLSGCVPSSLQNQLIGPNTDLGGLPFC